MLLGNPEIGSLGDAVEFSLKGLELARVQDIILGKDNTEYEKFGAEKSVGAIKYRLLSDKNVTKDKEDLPVAFPLDDRARSYPLKNEIVLLTKAPSGFENDENSRTYYLSIVSLFDNVNHNSIHPDYSTLDLGNDLPEVKVNNLQPYSGDYIIQGRLGNSLRFSGYAHPDNKYTDDSNNGKPFTIIRNGQFGTENNGMLQEDINQDDSSIYLTSDHTIPLEQIRDKFDSNTKDPILGNEYKGRQIIVDSGRIFLNAKDEDILLSSKESFGVSSKDVSIDGEDYIGLDAKKIYLGERARRLEDEPAIKGDALESYLNTLNMLLIDFCDTVKAGRGVAKTQAPVVNLGVKVLKSGIVGLQRIINPGDKNSNLKSKKVFIQ